MKNVLMALAALPLMAGVATAGQLSDRQMDQVTAGFTALSIADAQGLVGESGIVLVTTATVSQVLPIATAVVGETRSSLFKSLSAAQSSTVTSTYNPVPIPGLGG
jgi:fructose-specific phosphotransferase system IIC component